MRRNPLYRSLIVAASLTVSSSAHADWWDYTSDGFDPARRAPGELACDYSDVFECARMEPRVRRLTHDDMEGLGIVFVHGMGEDCAPERDPDAATATDREGLVTRSGDPREDDPDSSYYVGGQVAGWNTGGAPAWLVRPDKGDVCAGPDYWGTFMLNQVATLGAPVRANGERIPTLVAGYNGRDAWGGSGASEPPAYTVARQIDAFMETYELDRVAVITHSMGGVVMRDLFTRAGQLPDDQVRELGADYHRNDHYAVQLAASRISRVITIAAPQNGSKAADQLDDYLNSPAPGAKFIGEIAKEHPLLALPAVLIATLWVEVNGLVDGHLEARDHGGTRSVQRRNMARANAEYFASDDDLHVEWDAIIGTDAFNFIDDEDEVRARNRERSTICRAGWTPGMEDEACFESFFLWALNSAVHYGPNTDGMVHISSAAAVGNVIGSTRGNHHHNRMGDISYSTQKLDQIGILRYYAHADGDPDPYFAQMLDLYAQPELPIEEPIDADGEVRAPSRLLFRRDFRDADCTTHGVVGLGDELVSHTGQFDVRLWQPYTPQSPAVFGWPTHYSVRVTRSARPRVIGQGPHEDWVLIPDPEDPIAHEAFFVVDQPEARPAGPGVVEIAIPVDLRDLPGQPEIGAFDGAAGDYTVAIAACDEDACTDYARVEGTVQVTYDEWVNPHDWLTLVECSQQVEGGRVPRAGVFEPPEIDLDAAKNQGLLDVPDHGLPSPNTVWHQDDPIWPWD